MTESPSDELAIDSTINRHKHVVDEANGGKHQAQENDTIFSYPDILTVKFETKTLHFAPATVLHLMETSYMNDLKSLLSPAQRSELSKKYPSEIVSSNVISSLYVPIPGNDLNRNHTKPPIHECYLAPLSKLSQTELLNNYIVRNAVGGSMGENSTALQLPTSLDLLPDVPIEGEGMREDGRPASTPAWGEGGDEGERKWGVA